MQNEQHRVYLFDNLKAILIMLVVFGHVIEPILTGQTKMIYIFIYLFHMPLFAFCSGYLAKYKPKKILNNMIYPFFLFQIIYLLFDKICLNNNTLIQFTTPYWIMWYLLAIIVWTLFLPLIELFTNNKKNIVIIISFSFLIGILVGFEKTIGYYMSLSRIICFMPFFIMGFCVKKAIKIESIIVIVSKSYFKFIMFILNASIIFLLYKYYQNIKPHWLYGSYPYLEGGYSFVIRLINYVLAIIISIFIICITPSKKMFFSTIGQKTLPIYLFHGFVVKLISKYGLYKIFENQLDKILFSIVITILIIFLFSSDWMQKLTHKTEIKPELSHAS